MTALAADLRAARSDPTLVVLVLLGAAFAIAIGILAAERSPLAPVVLGIGVGAIALRLPPAAWVIGGLAFAFVARGMVEHGLAPGSAPYLDIPMVWVGFGLALATRRPNRTGQYLVLGIATLGICIAISTAVAGLEIQRGLFYLLLLGQPFAAAAALVLAPPSPQLRKIIIWTLLGLLAIQLPICFAQFALHGPGDPVQGTFLGSLAGAHLVGAISAVGAFWVLTRGGPWWTWVLGLSLAALPLVSGSKQVVFALPILLFVQTSRSLVQWGIRAAVIAVLVGILVAVPRLNETYGLTRISQTLSGQGTKEQSSKFVYNTTVDDPVQTVFGQGPATTVSRAAYLSDDPLIKENSPIDALSIAPAELTIRLGSLDPSILSSFDSAISSAVGLFGDLGIAGTLTYLSLLVFLYVAVRRTGSRESGGALAGIALMAVLGLIADWWEEGPLTVLVALLVGLALTDPDAHGLKPRRPLLRRRRAAEAG